MHAIYAIVMVGLIVFVVAGVVPESLEEEPLGFDIGAECEYPVSDSEDILKENIVNALRGSEGIFHVYEKGDSSPKATIEPESSGFYNQVDNAVVEIKALDPGSKVILKNSDGETVTQELIIRDVDNMTMSVYTEITIKNNLRYALKEIDIGVDMLNDGGTVDYRVLKGSPTTINAGDKAEIPINLDINIMNAVLTMVSGSGDSMDLFFGFDISGKYYFGLIGASVYVVGNISTIDDLSGMAITKEINENKIEINVNKKLENLPVELPENAEVTIGDVVMGFSNDDLNGLSVIVESTGTNTIVDSLKEKYDDEDYTITADIDGVEETFDIDKEQFAQMIDILETMMEVSS